MMKRLDKYRIQLEKTGNMNVDAHIFASDKIDIDAKALAQLKDACSLPSVDKVIATPDIHVGYGVPIGCVLAAKEIVSPQAVGYDINCGMRFLTTPLTLKDINIDTLTDSIRRDIPLGEGKTNVALKSKTFIKGVNEGLKAYPFIVCENARLEKYFNEDEFENELLRCEEKGSMKGDIHAVSTLAKSRGINQLGTLGGGNHFIEIQEVTDILNEEKASAFGIFKGMISIMIHSGSRGFGYEIAGNYMKLAREKCKQLKLPIPSKELAYLNASSKEGKDYMSAINAAANFAFINRLVMADFVRANIKAQYGKDIKIPSLYDVPHNMVKLETHDNIPLYVHRKGATRAYPPNLMDAPFNTTGQPVIIPGSMGTSSYILSGVLSGAESLYSVCHGAGRVLSRSQAAGKVRHGKVVKEALISDDDFNKSMEGIKLICEKKGTIKEEAPAAYKDIDTVIDTIRGAAIAVPVAKMRPLAVLKG
jgi:tRNA-splicing ligase RtcB